MYQSRFIRTVLSLALLGSLSALTACGGGRDRGNKNNNTATVSTPSSANADTKTETKSNASEIVVHLESDPPHFNYLIKPDAWISRIVNNNVTEPLVKEDPFTGEFKPSLAESWEISEDGLTYTFKLRKGVTWHDGQPFTSADVVFTFDKIFDANANTASLRGEFEPFLDETKKRYEAPDESTFKLYFKKKAAFIMEAIDTVPIIPKHVFETGDFNNHPANAKPVGTGPYVFENWERGKEVVLVKNPKYWGTPGVLEKLIWRQITAPEVAFAAARKGEIDMMGRLRNEQIDQLNEKDVTDSFNQGNYYPPQFSFFLFNMKRPVFQDKAVRQAFSMLVDRTTIANDLEKGRVRLIESPFIFGSPSYNTNLKPIEYNPDAAIKMLDDAGWKDSDNDGVRDKNGVKLEFSFVLTAGSTRLEKQMTLVQNDLKKAGMQMNLEKMEWSRLSEKLDKHDFDLVSFIQIFGSTKIDFYGLFHSSQSAGGGSNYGSYANEEVDKLVVSIREELDPAKRLPMEMKLQEILHDELPMFFMFGDQVNYMIRKDYTNTTPSATDWFQVKSFAMAQAK